MSPRSGQGSRYVPPAEVCYAPIESLLAGRRSVVPHQQKRLVFSGDRDESPGVWFAGDHELLARRCVAVVGSRKASPEGISRARRLSRELAEADVVVVSGLAEGIDHAAHTGAIEAGGRTIAVIGTPIDRVYPAKHARLQEFIYRDHLLVSPFEAGTRVYPSNFPRRNRVMAALTDATVIIEASEGSGTLHQASECGPSRLDRWLFITRSLVESRSTSWPKRFLESPDAKVRILDQTSDLLNVL